MGSSIENIGVELPTQLTILRRFYHFGRGLTESQKVSQLMQEIKALYEDAGIATIHLENIRHKLKALIHKAKSIISTRKLGTKNQIQKELEFFRANNSIFEISSINISFESQDMDRHSLQTDVEMLTQNHDYSANSPVNEIIDDDYLIDLNQSENISDSEYEPEVKKQKISSEMLKKINLECGLNASFRVMSTFIKIGIEIAGGNPNAYCASKSQLQSQLSKVRSCEKRNAIQQLISSSSKLLLQFDTKTCSNINKRHLGTKLRLVIILRSESNEITLGPFILSNHGAETCANQIIDIIHEHDLYSRIVGIVCDTENTNTGYRTGVCVRIEEFLQMELLRFMCRHHIYDLILKHVGQFLFGHTTAPTFDFGCSQLKNNWENLSLSQFLPYDDEFECELYMNFRENAVHSLKIQTETFQIRDDYAELTDLALKFFNESNVEKKRFMVPGAVSNARWMAKAIYTLKSYLFRHQLDIEESLHSRLRRFALFISTIYVKYWNWCPSVFNAPINDLNLLKELEKYRRLDNELANVAIESFCRHLTYLSDEMAVLAIFSNLLSNDEKERIRTKLQIAVENHNQRTNNSVRYNPGNEHFADLEITDFISHRSLFLLQTMNMDISFLQKSAAEWEHSRSYQNVRRILKNLLVATNDASERALGQTTNFINNQKARTEQNLQNLLASRLNKSR